MTEDLQTLLDDFVAAGIVGAGLSVRRDDQTLSLVAGLADRGTSAPVTQDHLFKIGSCTKTFVAATLMSLVGDRKVSLDASVAQWFPQLPNAERIRVRQLIDHSAGLPEFEYVMAIDPERLWTPTGIVDLAYATDAPDEPGHICTYNNTGYVLAGMLIEAVSGQSLAAQIRNYILDPLGLHNTFAAAGESYPRSRLAHGYYHRPQPSEAMATASVAEGGEMWRADGVLGYSDDLQDSTKLFPMTGAYAAGDMVGTAADLAAFLAALVSGQVLGKLTDEMVDRRRTMTMSTPGTRIRESGAGMLMMEYAGRPVLGHQGSMPGYVTLMIHDRNLATTVALTTNTGSGNRLSFYASGLHGLMDAVLERLVMG